MMIIVITMTSRIFMFSLITGGGGHCDALGATVAAGGMTARSRERCAVWKHPNLCLAVAGPRTPKTLKQLKWAIAVRRGSYKSLFLLYSGPFSLEKKRKSSSEFGLAQTLQDDFIKQFSGN